MRVLYLLNNQQDSITEFASPNINLPWVDALLDKLVTCESISIALAVPVNKYSVQKIQKNGITVYGLPNPKENNIFKKAYKRFTRAADNFKTNSSIPQVINDFEPDIVQVFGSENSFGLIAKQINKPVIIHIQGYLFVLQRKWFTGISKWEQFRYASIKDLLLMRGCYHDSFTFRKKAETSAIIMKNCDYFMGRTNFDKGIASLISPGSRYFHCEEFLRKEFFDIQWNFPLQNEITCISILKGACYKGIDLLIEVLLILKKHSGKSFKLKICGVSANEEIIRILKKKYNKEINLINIEFLGKLSAEGIVRQLCDSNFYIHPSYVENSPNSICEAMALGMPVIATNVGGVSSIVEDEVEGILVQEGEPYSLAGAIVYLTNNYEKAKQLGSKARIKALERHAPNEIVNSLLKIYDSIIYENGR